MNMIMMAADVLARFSVLNPALHKGGLRHEKSKMAINYIIAGNRDVWSCRLR